MQTADGRDQKTWMAVMQHIHKFEEYTDFKSFEQIKLDKIKAYIDSMTGKNLSLSFVDHNVKALKKFFEWLPSQKGYKKMDYNLSRYFQLTKNQRNTARAMEYKESYELSDIRQIISNMPSITISDRRNKAMVSLQALCGLRISELRSIKIKSLIFDKPSNRYMIYVSPKDMEDVKFAKTRQAFFMPFDKEWADNVINWKAELVKAGWQDKDPLFPIIPNRFNETNLWGESPQKIKIKSNTSILKVFKDAFTGSGQKYIRPHSFRHTIARWAETKTPEVFNAVRQSLGHSDIKTTFDSYGAFSPSKIAQILNKEENNQ